MLKLQEVIRVLNAKPKGKDWQAYCPVHESSGQHSPSLVISRGSKGQEVVFACQSQHCDQKAIVAAVVAKLAANEGSSDHKPTERAKGWIIAPWDRWQPLSESTYTLIAKMREGRGYMPKLDTLKAFDFREITHRGKKLVGFPYMLPEETESIARLGPKRDIERKIKSLSWEVANIKWFDPSAAGKTKFVQDGPHRRQDVLFGMKQLTSVKFPDNLAEGHPFGPASHLFIVEGQWDAMCLWELGYSALAVEASGQKEIAPAILTILSSWQRLFLLLDNDEAGRKCRDRLADIVPTQTAFVNYPGDTKDMCELMAQMGPDFIGGALYNIVRQPIPRAKGRQEAAPAEYTLGVVCAEDDKPEAVDWLWDYRIPKGMLTAFAGNPDVGKSTVLRSIVAAATTGGRWPDCDNTNKPCKVLMAVGEESTKHTTTPGLIAAGANLKMVRYIMDTLQHQDKKHEARMLALDTDVHIIKKFVEGDPTIGLIIFDPLTGYLGRARKQNDQEVRHVLTQLKILAESTGVTVLTLDHFNKNFEQEAIHRISGSMALAAVPRVAWGFVKDDEDESGKRRIMLNIKGNIIPDERKQGLNYQIVGKDVPVTKKDGAPGTANVGVVQWLGKASTTIDKALARGPKTGSAEKWLKDFLSDGPRLSREMYSASESAGHAEATIRVALKNLNIKSVKKADGWWSSLPGADDF